MTLVFTSCSSTKKTTMNPSSKTPFVWEGANLYFLLTDRFKDGNDKKEIYFDRTKTAGKLRGFEGGNIKGIIQKIDDGYFEKLESDVENMVKKSNTDHSSGIKMLSLSNVKSSLPLTFKIFVKIELSLISPSLSFSK